MPRRVRARPPAMRQEQDRTGQAHRLVKHRHDETLILVSEVGEQVRAQHEPARDRHERDARPDTAPDPPARDDVHTQKAKVEMAPNANAACRRGALENEEWLS